VEVGRDRWARRRVRVHANAKSSEARANQAVEPNVSLCHAWGLRPLASWLSFHVGR
jgi:hypothetical protein